MDLDRESFYFETYEMAQRQNEKAAAFGARYYSVLNRLEDLFQPRAPANHFFFAVIQYFSNPPSRKAIAS
jgi:hypothetical protein